MLDAGADKAAEERGIPAEVDELALARPAGEVDRAIAGRRLCAPMGALVGSLVVVVVAARRNDRIDKHLGLPLEPGAVALEPDRLLDGEELVEPAPLLGRRAVVREPRRRCARAWRERRGEDLVVAHLSQEVEGRPELPLSLAAEAHDHVGRDRDARQGPPDRPEPLEVVLDR